MDGMGGRTLWALTLAIVFVATAPIEAAPPGKNGPACPPVVYSPLHYWAPGLYRLRAWFHAPRISPYPVARCPHSTSSYEILTYPCPAEEPAVIYAQRYWSRNLGRTPPAKTGAAPPSTPPVGTQAEP